MCWICFDTDDDLDDGESVGDWVSPCKCSGTGRWVIFIIYFFIIWLLSKYELFYCKLINVQDLTYWAKILPTITFTNQKRLC